MNNLPHTDPNLAWPQTYYETYFIWLNWIYFNIVYRLVAFSVWSATHSYTPCDCFLSSFLRSSLPEVFCKKVALKNFPIFTGKHLCQSLFFNKVAGAASNFIKKETLTQVFSCEFCKIFKNSLFLKNTSGGCFCYCNWVSVIFYYLF